MKKDSNAIHEMKDEELQFCKLCSDGGHLKMVQFLLQKGINTNFVNKFNETPPLNSASIKGQLEVAK